MNLLKLLANSQFAADQPLPPPATDDQSLPEQSLILEPILTPSGLPVDVEHEAIADDPVVLPAFDEVTSDLDVSSSLDPVEVETAVDFQADDLPVFEEETDWTLYDFLQPDEVGFESGTFIVGETGEVTIDYLFDGGGYQGELAIFSLDGMVLPGTDEFVEEDFIRLAAERALSDSEWGHIAISDRAEGARFSGHMPGEGKDLNVGDYLGAKTFQMRPGDEIGFMLVPNGRVQEVLNNPDIGGAKTPLFSFDSINPSGMFHAGQIADVTGDGNTFVFEDLRVDGQSDLDYNDLIFQVRGAEARNVQRIEDITGAPPTWMETDLGEAIIAHALPDSPSIEYRFDAAAQPLVGVLDTGLNGNNPDLDYSRILLGKDWVGGDDNPLLELGETDEHGTQTLGLIGATQDNDVGIDGINDDAPLWVGRAVGSGQWSESLVEFVDAAKDSGQPNAVVNLSFDLTQVDADGNITTRYELTPEEQSAIEYARQNGVLIVAAAGNDGGVMSALGQASQLFDNIITVGAANGLERADFSSYGYGLDLLAEGFAIAPSGETVDFAQGTSVAAARVTGAVSQVWAANPDLSYRQVIELLKTTAQDVEVPGWDVESGFGLLNMAAAVQLAKVTQGQTYGTPAIEPTDTWSGAGVATPQERAAAPQFAGHQITGNAGVTASQRRPYVIRRGDTLWAIAQRELGNGNRWREITKNAAGSQTFTDAEARRLRIGQVVYLPVKQQVATGRPIVTPPMYTPPRGTIGKNSRAPYLFEQAYARIRGAQNNMRPIGDAYRWGDGWIQKFRNSQGHESWLMLEDGAKTAFWVFGSNLDEYKFMGGPVGKILDGRSVFLGYPRSDEKVFIKDGKRAVWQAFAADNGKARIHNHYGAASVATWGVIGSLYTDMAGAQSFLGMPTRREYMDGDTVWADFRGGKVAYHRSTGKVEALRHGQQPSWRQTNIILRPETDNLRFYRGQEWTTVSGYKFRFQLDGNLVLSTPQGKAIWATGTNGSNAHYLAVQTDGNVVLYDSKDKSLWATDTAGNSGAYFAIQGDGHLVVYSSSGKAIYASGTNGGKRQTLSASAQWLNKGNTSKPGYVSSSVGLNFRTGPSTSASRIGTLANGTKLTILARVAGGAYSPGNRTDWYKVQIGSRVGYVAAYYVKEGNPSINTGWQHPLPSYKVTSEYGPRWGTFHYGIDIGAPTGTPVKSAKPGKVVEVGYHPNGWGRFVRINHDGFQTIYAHLSATNVSVGQSVNGGTVIGKVGSTGYSTGPHLHFEIRVAPFRWKTDNRNPRNYIKF